MSIELECLPSKCTALGNNDHLELHVGNPAGSSETASKHREIAIPIFGAVAASKQTPCEIAIPIDWCCCSVFTLF